MPVLNIILQEPAWPELNAPDAKVVHTTAPIGVTGLAGGMQSGKPSVAFRIDLPDGTAVIAETSMALFLSAADVLRAKYGDPRHD
jgi:hypothetical protein